jgi:glycosyltransferase involved in cell wall biosynthesis
MVTVFTSSFNYGKYLPRAIESVLKQSYGDFEYHLVDYGSTDNTWEIIKSYNDPRIVPMQIGSQKNKSAVMNHSVRLAKGSHWVWCPADDYLHPDLLRVKMIHSEQFPDSILYDDFWVVNENNYSINEVTLPDMSQEFIRREIWNTSLIAFTGIFIPVGKLIELPWPEDENISEDYQWMIEATIRGYEFVKVPMKLHYKRNHSKSVTYSDYSAVISNMQVIWDKVRSKYGSA